MKNLNAEEQFFYSFDELSLKTGDLVSIHNKNFIYCYACFGHFGMIHKLIRIEDMEFILFDGFDRIASIIVTFEECF